MTKVQLRTICKSLCERTAMIVDVTVLCYGQSLQSLADLRTTPHFPFSGELDLAVGGAVESMGPEVVLGAIPLNITGYE